MTEWPADKVQRRSVKSIIPYARNSRTHSDEQVAQIAASIKEWGFTNPVLVDVNGEIIAGHGRVLAAQKLGLDEVPTMTAIGWSEAQKRAYVIADNKLALNAGWNDQLLEVELSDLQDADFDLSLLGFSDSELKDLLEDAEEPYSEGQSGALSDKFLAPPFSVLNAREGWWQDRKRSWLSLGIASEEGRGEELLGFASLADKFGQRGGTESNTSVFDPVLCELAYTWFSPKGGIVLDPFAGGSVRGIVASKLCRQYAGHELRAEQVQANRKQADDICSDPMPVWHVGDSRKIDKSCADVKADMLFSCPPYADLEVYSDDPADISNMPYDKFLGIYREIIHKSCNLLKEDSFACFVVGDVRDKSGNYYNFVSDTITAFLDAGLNYYNEAILVTSVGSLPLRVGRQFSVGRKLGKTHQNVLIFVKGDGKRAAEKCGPVEVYVPEDDQADTW
jgi:hypothetical protein